jgi:hypothetical protein
MPKVQFNQLIQSFSGKVGDMIFYQADGQNLSRTAPKVVPDRTEKQQANSSRFLAAQKYAQSVLADPALKAAYKALCQGHQNPRNLAIRDAMRPPVIESMNLEGYAGKPGETVRVRATDDFRVAQVQVSIRGAQGELIEEGPAELQAEAGEWQYEAKAEVPEGRTVSVTAVAKDNPGNTAECQRWHYIGAPAA